MADHLKPSDKDIADFEKHDELSHHSDQDITSFEESEKVSPMKAAGLGAINQYGMAPAVGGAALAANDVYQDPKHDMSQLLEQYRKHRDELKGTFKQAEEQQPMSYLGGNIAAGMALPIPGTSLKGLSGLKLIGKSAGLGAFAGLGASEGDLTEPSIENIKIAGKDLALGAGLGMGSGVIGEFLGRVSRGAKSAKQASEDVALKSLGINKDIATKEYGFQKGLTGAEEGYRKGIGKTLIDENILKPFGGANQVRNDIKPLLEKQGNIVKDIRSQAANLINEKGIETKPFDDDIQKIENYFAQKLEGTSDGDQRLAKIKSILDKQKDKYNFIKNDVNRLNDLKTNLEKDLTDRAFSRNVQDLPEMQEVDLSLSKLLKNRIEDAANMAQPGLGNELRAANAKMSNYLDIATAATDRAVQDLTKKSAEVGDYVALGFGIPTYLAKKGFEFQTGQSVLDTLQKMQALGLKGGAKLLTKPAVSIPIAGTGLIIEKLGRTPTNLTGMQTNSSRKEEGPVVYDNNELMQRAEKLQNNPDPKAQELAQTLSNIASKSSKEKNALMFSLLSQPHYRKFLKDTE